MTKLCDANCNNCPLLTHENGMMVTVILNRLHKKFGDKVHTIVQKYCPNMTVCHGCKIDDFLHTRGCDV